jgi:hypothetical protein
MKAAKLPDGDDMPVFISMPPAASTSSIIEKAS